MEDAKCPFPVELDENLVGLIINIYYQAVCIKGLNKICNKISYCAKILEAFLGHMHS